MPRPPTDWPVLAAVSAGGALGALARAAVLGAWPAPPGGFAWSTLGVNVSGCLLIGVLMTVVAELRPHRLVRPFLGVGVLGGYTTFSTYAAETDALLSAAPVAALAYLVATPLAALLAVALGSTAALALLRRVPETRA